MGRYCGIITSYHGIMAKNENDVSSWLDLAGQEELIYAYYDEDLNAEFVHIKDGVCVRAYLEYEGEVDTDEGEDPETAISKWSDVAGYMDEHMV